MTWAMLVPRKGTEFLWIAKRGARFIDQLGHNRVTLRCDNEPAVEALAREIGQARQEGSQTVPERPPVAESPVQRDHRTCGGTRGRSGQNVESCVGASHWNQSPARRKDTVLAGGICCVPDEQLQHRQRRKDAAAEAAWPKGQHTCSGIRKMLYMPAKPARGRKWEPRFHHGVFVGLLNSSSEAVVVTEQGTAITTRSANIRRIPESERWEADRIL